MTKARSSPSWWGLTARLCYDVPPFCERIVYPEIQFSPEHWHLRGIRRTPFSETRIAQREFENPSHSAAHVNTCMCANKSFTCLPASARQPSHVQHNRYINQPFSQGNSSSAQVLLFHPPAPDLLDVPRPDCSPSAYASQRSWRDSAGSWWINRTLFLKQLDRCK